VRPISANGIQRGQIWVEAGEGEEPVAHEVVIGDSDGRLTVLIDDVMGVGQEVITDIVRIRRGD